MIKTCTLICMKITVTQIIFGLDFIHLEVILKDRYEEFLS